MDNCIFVGNIGCGKSTWLKNLQQRGFPVVGEKLEDITFLQDYWVTQNYAFHTQIGFYASWLELYNKATSLGGAFIDSSMLSHHLIFTKNMYDNSLLSKKEFDLCQQLFDSILQSIHCKYIFLFCALEENVDRAEKRARKFEIRDRDFISLLHTKYNELYEKMKNDMIFIDITHLSPVIDSDFEYFYNCIKEGGINIDSRT